MDDQLPIEASARHGGEATVDLSWRSLDEVGSSHERIRVYPAIALRRRIGYDATCRAEAIESEGRFR